MIHFSSIFVVHLLTSCCQFSYTSFVLETYILLPPPSTFFQNTFTPRLPNSQDFHHHAGPDSETEYVITVTSNLLKVHSLKAAIFHTMAFKLSLENNKNKVTPKSLIAFLKVPYNTTQIKTKHITFEQYSRIHLTGPKIGICETASNVVFVLNFSFTTKDQRFSRCSSRSTRSNCRFQSYAPRFWLHAKIRSLWTAQASNSSSATTSFIPINDIYTHILSLRIHLSHSFILLDDVCRCNR